MTLHHLKKKIFTVTLTRNILLMQKNLEKYHDLYFQIDTLLLADLFEKFWNMCLEIYDLDAAPFLTAPGLAC